MNTKLYRSVLLAIALLCNSAYAQWNIGIPVPEPLTFGHDTVSVTIIGDVMMHTPQLKYDHHSFLEDLAPMMKASDFAAAGMEFSLGGEPYTGYPCFSAPDWYADYLASEIGANVMLLANNHIFDRGWEGMTRSLDVYRSLGEKYGVAFTGCSADESEWQGTYPLILEKKGIRIAVINFTYGENCGRPLGWPRINYMDKDDVSMAISRARDQKADFIVAIPHWGEEYRLHPSQEQKEWAEWLQDQGVDAVVGSHPHVVQDSTHIKGMPVIYSTGNAVSNMSKENTRLEMAVVLRFVSDRINGTQKMLEPEIHLLWCSLPGKLCGSYKTILVEEYLGCRNKWLDPSDYDNMVATMERVCRETTLEKPSVNY